jgi:hypothetical protein
MVQRQGAGGFAPAVEIGFAVEGDVVHQFPSLNPFDSIHESPASAIRLTPLVLLALY